MASYRFTGFTTLLAAIAALAVMASGEALAQSTGTILGTGTAGPGTRDSNWRIVAYPAGFMPPSGQTAPYNAYVPTNAPGSFVGGGFPQTGVTLNGAQSYWIAPQATTSSLVAGSYNWIVAQDFNVPATGFYRFDFPGAGDNELEFYIGGSVDTSNPTRPTINGGQQIGGRAGGFGSVSTFTGGAQMQAGTNTAYMVLWDYGGETGAIIGQSDFSETVAYWAPTTGAGGNGTWTNNNVYWSVAPTGIGSKAPWTSSVGVAYFGGTPGTVSVGENVNLTKAYFTTGSYSVQSSGGTLVYGTGAEIIASSGTTTISASQNVSSRLKVSGNATTRLTGNTVYGFGGITEVTNGKLLVDGYVGSPVTVVSGQLGGSGRIDGTISGAGLVNPGNSPGILSATAVNPTGGLDFTFEFSGTTPNYANASASTNDVLRLTGGAPFTAALTSANTKTLFLNFTKEQLTPGVVLKGGFFTDVQTDFVSFLNNVNANNGGFQVYVLGDGNGTDNSLNGQGYYNWRNPSMFEWTQSLFLSTTPQTANFAGGTVNGQVMTLTVAVPEPSVVALASVGLAGIAAISWRKRRAKGR